MRGAVPFLLLTVPALAQSAPPGQMTQEAVPQDAITSILGRQVMSLNGQPAARVIDVLVDGDGRVQAAVLEIGGFMGLGQRRIAVAWRALRFIPPTRAIILTLDAQEIAALPEYRPGAAPVIVATPPPPAPE